MRGPVIKHSLLSSRILCRPGLDWSNALTVNCQSVDILKKLLTFWPNADWTMLQMAFTGQGETDVCAYIDLLRGDDRHTSSGSIQIPETEGGA